MRRILKWVALGAAGILVVLIGLLLSLPLLLDSGTVRAAALQHLARATGGQWRLDNLELSWFPRPAISARGVAFSIPGSAEGKVEQLSLTTALLPLLWGDVRLSRVALAAPDITVTLAGSTAPSTASAPGTFTVSDLRAALSSVIRPPGIDLRALDFTIERGRVALAVPGQTSLTFTDIHAHATQREGTFEIEVSSATDLSHRIDVKVSLDPQRFEGDIELDVKELDLGALLAVAGVQGDPQLKGLVSARARIKADGSPALRGAFDASMAALSIDSSAGKLDLRDVAMAGEAQWTDSGLQITGKEVRTAAPAVHGAAVLTLSPDWNRQRLEVTLQPASLEVAKQLALPWTTGTPEVERYARMITAGELRELQARLQLDQINQWQTAIAARGTLAGAAMRLERPDLSLREVSARLELAQGKLIAEEVQAASGNSAIQSGRIALDFAAAPTRMSANARWRADLDQALAFTRRQLAASERAKLDSLRALTGSAQGSVALSGTFDNLQVLAEAAQIRAQASLDQIPWPINVTGAQVRFDGNALAVQGLGGTIGKSTFSQCSGRVTLDAAAKLRIDACGADLAAVELFDWASRRFPLPDAAKGLRVLVGRGLVQVHGLSGPLADPGKWSGDTSVTPRGLRLTHPEAPGPLRLDGGSVRVDPGALQIAGVKAELLDTALQLSGSVTGLRDGTPRLDLQATGAVGKRIIDWGWRHARLADKFSLLEPFEARPARVRWPVDGGVEAGGELIFAGKTAVSFDARIEPGLVDLRKLAVQDEKSNMRIAVLRHKSVLEGSFAGTLSGSSLDRIVRARQLPQAQMSGNLTYRVPLKEPRDFRANGSLRVSDLTSLGWWLGPMHMTIHRADVKATERTLRLDTSFSIQEAKFDVNGTLRGTDERYALDLDVKSDDVDVEQLLGPHEEHAQQRRSEEQPASWDFPVEGTVRVALKSLHRGFYRVAPLIAAAVIAPGRIDFTVTQARLCGIGVAGGGRAEPRNMSVDVVLRARDIDPQPTLLCLTRERTELTGRFDADAHFTAAGRYRELPQLFQGPFHMVAREGRVDRMTGLAQILNLVNASELLRGRSLSLSATGFAYDKFVMRGKLEGAVIGFDEVVLDAQPFDLVARGSINWVEQTVDMNVAVAPLQIANTVVKMLPFLGYVLGGGIYAVPVGVRGPLSNPQIVPVAPTAVAGTFLGMLERTLKTPFNLREALIPPAMQGGNTAEPSTLAPVTNTGPAQQ